MWILKTMQECFNSPYGFVHFPVYAETIGFQPGQPYDVEKSESDSVKMLSAAAKATGAWLLGGMSAHRSSIGALTAGAGRLHPGAHARGKGIQHCHGILAQRYGID